MMKELDIKLLKEILSMSQAQLYNYLYMEIKKYYKIVDTDNKAQSYIYCVGKAPILLVAHLDTVYDKNYLNYFNYTKFSKFDFEYYNDAFSEEDLYYQELFKTNTDEEEEEEKKDIFYDQEYQVLWSPDGLGADDRAGVFLILTLIKNGFRPHILFTTDEEVGGTGAKRFANIYRFGLKHSNIKYILELDRHGYDDCVFYDCDNKKFESYINTFGFKTQMGSFSDISIICPIVGIAGVNISIGYIYEHTLQEMLYLTVLGQIYHIIIKMTEDSYNLDKKFKYIKKVYSITNFKTGVKCAICDSYTKSYAKVDKIGFVCNECYKTCNLKEI